MADEKDKDGEKGEEAKEASAPKAGGKKKILLFAVAGLVLLALGIGIPVTIMTLKAKPKDQVELPGEAGADAAKLVQEGANDEDELQEDEEPLGAIFPLDTFVVNLFGGRFLRCQVQIEFVGRDVPRRFYARLVPVRDGIITLLASRSADDALNAKTRDAIRHDIKDLINELLKKEEVKGVYFTQFVVQ